MNLRQMFISAFILVISVSSLVNCQCQFEQDIDYYGNDLSTSFVYYSTQDLCCAACQVRLLGKIIIKESKWF